MSPSEGIRLILLGTPQLEGAGPGAAAVLSQQKRLALLAYVAVRREFVRRDDVVGLFWPDMEPDRGRAALSQSLHFLRRALGQAVIQKRGVEEIRLAPNVWCDTAAFEAAHAEGRLDDALDLYRGELLRGVDVSFSAEFSIWLDGVRARFHRRAAEAATTLSERCFRAGDLDAAVKWQRRALELQNTDEVTLRNYLALLDEIGDGATAVAEFEAFRQRLEKTFQLEPSRETLRIVDRIRSRRPETRPTPAAGTPARPTAEPAAEALTPAGAAARPAAAGASITASVSTDPTRAGRLPAWLGQVLRTSVRPIQVAAAMILVLGALIAWEWSKSGTAASTPVSQPDPNRIAVLYLDVRGDTSELGYLAEGITEELISNLSSIPSLEVISPNGVRRYRNRAWEADSLFHRLGVSSLISGSVSGTRHRASVTLRIENRSNVVLKPIQRDFTGGDVLNAIQKITEEIVAELGPVLNEAMTFDRLRAGTQSDKAWDFLAKARSKRFAFDGFTAGGPVHSAQQIAMEADKLLLAAIEADRKWVDPHILRGDYALGMAWACEMRGGCEAEEWLHKAIRYAEDALEISANNARALELRGRAKYQLWTFGYADGDSSVMNDAERDLVAAATQDGTRAAAWQLLSSIYLARNEFTQAANAASRALALDAFHEDRVAILFTLYRANFHLGNHATAADMCNQLTEAQGRRYWPAIFCNLSLQAWGMNTRPDPHQALEMLQDEGVTEPQRSWNRVLVAAVLARAGDKDRAREMINQTLASVDLGQHDEILHFAAAAYARLGDTQRADALLNAYINARPAERTHVRREFWFRSLPAATGFAQAGNLPRR